MRRSLMLRAVLGGVIGVAAITGGVAAFALAQPVGAEYVASATPTTSPRAERNLKASLDEQTPTQDAARPSPTPVPGTVEPAEVAAPAPVAEPALEPEPETTAPEPAPDPLPGPVSDDYGSFTAEQAEWLAFQQVVRDCMAGAGQEYLYWEWWSGVGISGGMPTHLVGVERAAWELALSGDGPLGDEYRSEEAGCWGYAAELFGNTN